MIIHTSAFVHNFPIVSTRIKHCTQISLRAFQFLINVKARDQETESLLSADSLPLNTPNSHSWARTRKSKKHNPGFPKGWQVLLKLPRTVHVRRKRIKRELSWDLHQALRAGCRHPKSQFKNCATALPI